MIFSFVFIRKDDISLTSRFVVHTGYRTNNPWEANSYPIMTRNETIFTRLYYCMIDAGIGTQVCPSSPVYTFQSCIEAKYDCTAQPTMQVAWPTDYGFLHCLQDNYRQRFFNVSVGQSNAFLDCLDSSMIATSESIQTSDSSIFLGSYNYVAFLLAAMTIISSFVVAMWGGYFTVNPFKVHNGHISGFWTPMSYFLLLVAFVWDFAALLFAVGIYFTTQETSSNPFAYFPTTNSTTTLVVGTLWAVSTFFGYYVVQAFTAGIPLGGNASSQQPGVVSDASADLVFAEGGEDGSGTVPGAYHAYPWGATNPWNSTSPSEPAPDMYTPNPRRSSSVPRPASASKYNGLVPMFNRVTGRYIGYEVIPTNMNDKMPYNVMAPLMMQMHAWCWVFVDGLFFVGMMTPQSSPLTEDVVGVYIFVTVARVYQLGYAFLFNQAFIQNGLNPSVHAKGNKYVYGVQVTAIMTFIASLLCLGNALYCFLRQYEFLDKLDLPNSSTKTIQICFLIFIGIAPEVLRTLLLIMVSLNQYSSLNILVFSEVIFVWEYAARFAFASAVIWNIPNELKDAINDLRFFVL